MKNEVSKTEGVHTGSTDFERQGWSKIYKWLIGSMALATLLLYVCIASLPDGRMHVFFLDIGQGDGILVRTPADEYVLIDGGPDDRVIRELGRVMPFYEHTIDIIILSHPHADHVNGFVDVLKRFEVRQVVMPGVVYRSPGYRAFLDQVSQQKIDVILVGSKIERPSDKKIVGIDYQLGGLIFDMLFPDISMQGLSFNNVHESMVVFRLLYGKRSFMFTGDMEKEKEQQLVDKGLELRSDLLKVGHHGSKTSSSEAFLEKVRPTFAVISCGVNNKFKHPFPLTLEHLGARNIQIYRTDVDGLVEALSDGDSLVVESWGK